MNIEELRATELPIALAAKLAPFINAYRPHDAPPTRDELKDAGYEKIDEETFVDELNDYYFTVTGHYPDELSEEGLPNDT
jgi:hypothetical protein